MSGEKKKAKVPEPYTPAWERLADQLARSWTPEIKPCRKCKYPTISGYMCVNCDKQKF